MTFWRWLRCRVPMPYELPMLLRCWVRGHQEFLETTPDRLRLRCLNCHRVTEGWPIAKAAGRYDKLASRRVLRLVRKRSA